MRFRIHAQFGWCLLAVATLLVAGCSSQEVIGPADTHVDTDTDGVAPKITVTTDYSEAQPETHITFDLSKAGYVLFEITNATGYHVRTLVDDEIEAGSYSILWDIKNDDGEDIGGGIYLIHLVTSGYEVWTACYVGIPTDLWGE